MELARSFVGALRRLPNEDVAALISILRTYRLRHTVLRRGFPGRRSRHAVSERPSRLLEHYRRQPPLALRQELLCLLDQRWGGDLPEAGDGRRVETLVEHLMLLAAREWGIRATKATPGLLKQLLTVIAQDTLERRSRLLRAARGRRRGTLWRRAEKRAGHPAEMLADWLGIEDSLARSLWSLGLTGLAFGGGYLLALRLGPRLSLTVTTLLYVIMTNLLEVNLPFHVYERLARLTLLLLEPPVALAALVALEALLFDRYQRRLERRLLGFVLLAIYCPSFGRRAPGDFPGER